MKEDWKKQIKDKLADCEKPAPQLDWLEIERRVEAGRKGAASASPRVVSLWPRRVAVAAAVVLLAGGAAWVGMHYLDTTGDEVARLVPVRHGRGDVVCRYPARQHDRNIMGYVSRPGLYVAADTLVDMGETPDCSSEDHSVPSGVDDHAVPNGVDHAEPQNEVLTQHNDELAQESQSVDSAAFVSMELPTPPTYAQAPVSRKPETALPGVTAKVYFSAGAGGSGMSSMPMLANVYSDMADEAPGVYESDAYMIEQKMMSTTHVKHHLPIRGGVSLRFPLSRHWAVEGGVRYTSISSDITTGAAGTKESQTCSQKLQYVGIPVSAVYNIWTQRKLNVYTSLGGAVEKMVKGSQTADLQYGNYEETSVKISGLQWSLRWGAGAEYWFTGNLSLYAEPELNYYIKHSSEVSTLYYDRPLNVDINIGLRFMLK